MSTKWLLVFPREVERQQDATGAFAIARLAALLEKNGAMNACRRIETKEKNTMRSDLIFGALTHVENRYQLCQLASKATRKLHKPNTRLQDTTNEVLDRFKDTIPMDDAVEPRVEKVYVDSASPSPERRAA